MLNKLEPEIEPEDGSIGPVGNTGDIELMESIIKDYKEYLEFEADSDDVDYLENIIKRLDIAKTILLVSRNSSNIGEQYQGKTIEELFDLLDATYEPEDLVSSSNHTKFTKSDYSTIGTQINTIHRVSQGGSIDVYYATEHRQKQYDCIHKRTVTGSASSTLISYTNGKTKIIGTFSYPSEFNEKIIDRRNHQCLEMDYVKTVKRHDILANPVPGSGDVKAQACNPYRDNFSDYRRSMV